MFDDTKFLCKGIAAVIIIGLVIRFVVGGLLTYNYDVYHWALTISNFEAGNDLYGTAGYYYTPVWGYILGIFSRFYELFGIDMLGERFTDLLFVEDLNTLSPHTAFVTTIPFNIAVTALMAVSDLVSAYLLFWIVRETYDVRKAKICFAVWFLCPFAIAVGSIGGMFDSISIMMALLCICLLMRNQELLAGAMFTTAVLFKLFPAFLFFLFIAYIIVKHRDDWKLRIAKAGIGAILFGGVLMLPMALNGTLMDSLSLITARTSSDALYLSEIVKYGTPLAYVLEIVAAAILAHVFLKTKHGNDDRSFLFYCFLMMVLLFLIPGAPQYHLLLIPFLIMIAICADAKLRIPMAILFVTASVHMLSPLVMDFLSLTMYTDLMSLDAWTSFYNMFAFHSDFMDMPGFDLWSTIIGIIDLIALILVAVTTFVRLLSKRTESALDGLR